MLKRTTFLISALCLLILANVLMMSCASPAFLARGEGFVGFMDMKHKAAFKNSEGFASKEEYAAAKAVRHAVIEAARTTTELYNPKPKTATPITTSTNTAESFANYSGSPGGARDTYQPMGAFDGVKLQTGNNISSWRYTAPNEPLQGNFPKFEPGQDNLFMFKDNQCKPECCGSSFSCDGGCVCTSPEQRDYINQRGGNRSTLDSGV